MMRRCLLREMIGAGHERQACDRTVAGGSFRERYMKHVPLDPVRKEDETGLQDVHVAPGTHLNACSPVSQWNPHMHSFPAFPHIQKRFYRTSILMR